MVKKHGLCEEFYKNGQLKYDCENGIFNGLCEEYIDNSKIMTRLMDYNRMT